MCLSVLSAGVHISTRSFIIKCCSCKLAIIITVAPDHLALLGHSHISITYLHYFFVSPPVSMHAHRHCGIVALSHTHFTVILMCHCHLTVNIAHTNLVVVHLCHTTNGCSQVVLSTVPLSSVCSQCGRGDGVETFIHDNDHVCVCR